MVARLAARHTVDLHGRRAKPLSHSHTRTSTRFSSERLFAVETNLLDFDLNFCLFLGLRPRGYGMVMGKPDSKRQIGGANARQGTAKVLHLPEQVPPRWDFRGSGRLCMLRTGSCMKRLLF